MQSNSPVSNQDIDILLVFNKFGCARAIDISLLFDSTEQANLRKAQSCIRRMLEQGYLIQGRQLGGTPIYALSAKGANTLVTHFSKATLPSELTSVISGKDLMRPSGNWECRNLSTHYGIWVLTRHSDYVQPIYSSREIWADQAVIKRHLGRMPALLYRELKMGYYHWTEAFATPLNERQFAKLWAFLQRLFSGNCAECFTSLEEGTTEIGVFTFLSALWPVTDAFLAALAARIASSTLDTQMLYDILHRVGTVTLDKSDDRQAAEYVLDSPLVIAALKAKPGYVGGAK